MKRFLTCTAAAALLAAPAHASINQSLRLVLAGNSAMESAVTFIKSGNVRSACANVKKAADNYASAYVLHTDARTLDLMQSAHNAHKKFC